MLSDKPAEPTATILHDRAAAETYVASVCFKHGPPRLLGVELEWTVHHVHDHSRYLDAAHLADALGAHAPRSLNPDSPQLPLPGGSRITVEPGGQVEISSTPSPSLATLIATVSADIAQCANNCSPTGSPSEPEESTLDPFARLACWTPPATPPWRRRSSRSGPDGIAMMCSTAGLQVCVDAGEGDRVAARWAAVHALGPVLTALFANSTQVRGPAHHLGLRPAAHPARHGSTQNAPPPAVFTADPAASWAARPGRAGDLCSPGERQLAAADQVELRRLDRRRLTRPADHRGPGLSRVHAVSSGASAWLSRGALSGRTAG